MNREERRRQQKHDRQQARQRPSALAGDALSRFEQAQARFEAGDLDQADELCQDASAAAPLEARPFHLRALIQYRLGNLSKAGEMILEAITRNDDDAEIHANCGAIMNMLARYPEAEAACRHVIELDPRRADAFSNLAVALEMQGRLKEALEACRKALELRADYPEARINMGNLLARNGDYVGAVEAYARVIDGAPDNPTAHANMSVALLRLNETDMAESCAREALALNPGYHEGLNALGNALAAQNRFDEAISAFDQALSLQPGSFEASLNRAAALHKSGQSEASVAAYRDLIVDGKAPGEVHAGLGVVLLATGQLEGAVQAFRDALAVKPGLGDAHYNLACALGDAINDEELAVMHEVLANPDLPVTEQISLHFAIGEIADKRGAYAEAFAAFQAGNDLSRDTLAANEIVFDAEAFDDEVAEIMSAYPAGFKSPDASVRSANTAPVFIVGMPRAGTTLVEQILAAHPEVSSLGEAATCLDVDPGDLTEAALADMDSLFAGTGQISRIMDKTPFHFLSVGAIEQIFPGARIIHCRRNSDDVMISCYFQNFVSDYAWATDLSAIQRYQADEKRMMAHWKQVSNLPLLTVDYEKLVAEPEATIRQLVDFLGLPWDDACLRHDASGTTSLSASNWQVRKPIYRTSVRRAENYTPYIKA